MGREGGTRLTDEKRLECGLLERARLEGGVEDAVEHERGPASCVTSDGCSTGQRTAGQRARADPWISMGEGSAASHRPDKIAYGPAEGLTLVSGHEQSLERRLHPIRS